MAKPKYRRRATSAAAISPAVRSWLDGTADSMPMEVAVMVPTRPGSAENELCNLWEICRDDILAAHVMAFPGTRPRAWWIYDSPEPRRRLGGVGEPHFDDRSGRTGLPTCWDDAEIVRYHGYGIAVDPNDPPTYEAQAEYLKRHGLLTRDEQRRLRAEDYLPEVVVIRLPTQV